ncbi:hypothetical protein [Enterococcus wangshanyuanii]|uniref:N-acetyltransferase domain-containing protein n=1 Tax=Enterococcus wangshanyuanii TaxID=2005703 RepID=A0ABQ1PWN8_9ENTE|nr:hypothetical protein [Enterococcus wangshanyuanii]GGD05602.1 hypothetical protein GCM10011573_38790 [Enterococcus wangshanyuanii]
MKNDYIQKRKFGELDLSDPFFSSLIADYPGFEGWFLSKKNQEAYVMYNEKGLLQGFLSLKDETEDDPTIVPRFGLKRRLKVSTFKIDAHGTVLGHRFLGILLKKMIEENFEEAYVTVFPKQGKLIELFEKFGFRLWGKKSDDELVYIRKNESPIHEEDIYKYYPKFDVVNSKKYLLSIWPSFHTKLFPDSKLVTEKDHIVEDLSFTNTVEKIYLTGITDVTKLEPNDLLVIYRTAERGKVAEWNACATTICTVVEQININTFENEDKFLKYCGKGSIFTESELRSFWRTKKYPFIIKMLYNVSLSKRIVRHDLFEKVGLSREIPYFGFFEMNNDYFEKIIEIGGVNESFIIN